MRDASMHKARFWTVAIAVASLCAGQAKAADQVWTGNGVTAIDGSGNLVYDPSVDNADNWANVDPNPRAWNPLVFGSGVVSGNMNIGPWAAFSGITVSSGNTTAVTITGGDFWNGGSPISLASAGADATMNASFLTGWGNIVMDVGVGRTLTMNGAIGELQGWAGNASLIKNGAGAAVLNAAPIATALSASTNGYYSGPTSINAGTLNVTYNGAYNGGVGTLPVGSSITVASGATLLAAQNALGYNSTHAGDTLTVNKGGSLTSAAGSTVSMPYALNVVGGTIASVDGGGGSYWGSFYYGSTQGTFTSASDGTPATISAQNFGLHGASFNVTDGAGAVDLSVTGNLIGGALTKNGAGVMRLSGNNSYTGATTVNGGTLQVAGAGKLGSGTYSGAISIGAGASVKFSSSGDQALTGTVSGAGAVIKDTGNGTLSLAGSGGNFGYTGAFTVSDGTLRFGNVDAVGSASGITVNNAGSVFFDQGTAGGSITAPISLSGDGGGNAALNTYTPNGQTTFSGPITMATGSLVRSLGNNSTINFTDAIHGTGVLVYAGLAGADTKTFMVLSGSSDFTGALSVTPWFANTQVTLSGGDDRLPTTALVAVHGSDGMRGALDLNGNNQAIGGLTDSQGWGGVTPGTRSVVNTSGIAVTLTLNTAANQSSGVSIGGTDINGTVGDNLSLVKTGIAMQTLTGASTYTGSTTVGAGTLAVDGSLASSFVTVAAGATLQGSGTLGGAVNVQGRLSPGNSPGVIKLGSLVLGASSTTLMEINGLARGTNYDGVNITGPSNSLTYGGGLSLNFGSLSPDDTTYRLFDFTGSSSGDFASVVSVGSYAGTWSSLGSGTFQLVSGGQTLTFSESTGNINVVPEPSSMALLGMGGVGLLTALCRRRA